MPDQMSPIFGTHLWDRLDKKTELPKLRRLHSAWMLSNFLHGEQGALLADRRRSSAPCPAPTPSSTPPPR